MCGEWLTSLVGGTGVCGCGGASPEAEKSLSWLAGRRDEMSASS